MTRQCGPKPSGNVEEGGKAAKVTWTIVGCGPHSSSHGSNELPHTIAKIPPSLYSPYQRDKPPTSSIPSPAPGCLIIGDEILNGKTHDTNSNYLAKFCFERGVSLESRSLPMTKRRCKRYNGSELRLGRDKRSLPLALHQPTLERMAAMSKHRTDILNQTEEQKTARNRMALVPEGKGAEILFVCEDLWVEKLYVLPGVPSLFRKLLDSLVPYLSLPLEGDRSHRKLIRTEQTESNIAPFLTSLQERLKSEGIQVGSYPLLGKGVTVSLIGRDLDRLTVLSEEVVKAIEGQVIESD
ncbi:molybdopterin-binding domain protein [Ceratobasidium sp. AG-Ba]|nr:molybdopterin-binding domain protein [Ceratobasidium sp. AG-Ba]